MPADTTLSRLGKTDFLGIVPAGFYLILVLASCFYLLLPNWGFGIDWNMIQGFQWLLAITALVVSFILGAIPRALRVDRTDLLCGRLFHSSERNSDLRDTWAFYKKLVDDQFPYPTLLKETAEKLRAHGCLGGTQRFIEPTNTAMTVFDYCKVFICTRSQSAFSQIEGLEARVRFYVGMFWSALVSLAIGAIALTFQIWKQHRVDVRWLAVLTDIVVVSTLFVAFRTMLPTLTSDKSRHARRLIARLWLKNAFWLTFFLLQLFFGLYVLSEERTNVPRPSTSGALLLLNAFSTLILWRFGERFRFVRFEEANQVFSTYLICRSMAQDSARGEAHPSQDG
jgi:hypothetical protein